LRDAILASISDFLRATYDDVLPVKSGEIMFPCVDKNGNELYAVVKVSIPRGTRNGEGGYVPYNGYDAAEAYQMEQDSKAQEKAVKKAMKEAEKRPKKKEE